MSQLVFSSVLRRTRELSSSVRHLRLNQDIRFYSAATNKAIIVHKTNSSKPLGVHGRSLYTQDSLGLEKVAQIRENKLQLYQNHKDRYIERLSDYLESANNQSILKEDIINLIGLAENEQHLDLLEKIITSLKPEHDFSASGTGTAVIRLYCTLNQVDRAYNSLKDVEKFGDFFNQFTAYRIGLTMLYNAGRFDHVLEIYELARNRLASKRLEGNEISHVPGLAIIALASLAKINTPEALAQAERLYSEVDLKDNNFMKTRFITFLTYMAYSNGKPTTVMNLISDAKSKNYVALREFKTLALLKLKRYEDVVYHLRDSIARTNDSSSNRPEKLDLILKEVLEVLESSMNEVEDEVTRQTLSDTLAELKQSKLVGESTLESIVFLPLKARTSYLDNFTKQGSLNRERFAARPSYNASRFDNPREDRFPPRNNLRNQQQGDFSRRRGQNDRQQRYQSKSYFEEDLETEFDDAISTQKRFR